MDRLLEGVHGFHFGAWLRLPWLLLVALAEVGWLLWFLRLWKKFFCCCGPCDVLAKRLLLKIKPVFPNLGVVLGVFQGRPFVKHQR